MEREVIEISLIGLSKFGYGLDGLKVQVAAIYGAGDVGDEVRIDEHDAPNSIHHFDKLTHKIKH